MFDPKSLVALHTLGGLQGLVKGLRTDHCGGLSRDEIALDGAADQTVPTLFPPIHHPDPQPYAERRRVFGENRLPQRKTKNVLQLMWIAFNDKVLILLAVVATVSLALGLYQTFGHKHAPGEPRVEWVEGVTIMTAVIIVVVVGALNDYQKERQFAKLNRKVGPLSHQCPPIAADSSSQKDDRLVKAIRGGRSLEISVHDVLVGDVLHLEPGDLVPADGVFISGHHVRCDESSVTGESDQIKKTPGEEVMARIEAGASFEKLDPFIISGSKVLEGVGTYLVTGVGVHSSYGKLMMAVTVDRESTPLQMKLGIMADQIATAGIVVAVLLFTVLFIRFLSQLRGSTDSPSQKGQNFLQILIVSITVVVIAVPEGLPLAVTLALAIAITRMLKDNNLVRILEACETMGNATSVCCDKTGTLTMNKMVVVAGALGLACRFDDFDPSNTDVVSIGDMVSSLSEEVRKILLHSIVINSTAFEGEEDGTTFVGSKTETALLSFAKDRLGMGTVNEERSNFKVVQVIPFDSRRKCMVSVTELSKDTYRMYVKGAPEIILDKCTRIITDATRPINATPLTEDHHRQLTRITDEYATRSLRTIGIAYRDFPSWSGAMVVDDSPIDASFGDIVKEMTFLGVIGIQDPLRPGVREAVAQCQHAGVYVRMVTGDSIGTAKATARECGILTPGGLVMEGPRFRQLSSAQMDHVVPHLQVLARSSPEDKRILVRRLKELGEIVAVTGDGTNDGPALTTADVGFSMGLSGTEVAKEASAIVLMDDNFSSIVKAIQWGRTVNDAVKKFLQVRVPSSGKIRTC